MTTFLLVSLGSAFGAPARYALDLLIQSRHERILPWGTWIINLTGSLLLGLLVTAAPRHGLDQRLVLAVGTGFLGAYTTFSTFTWESMRLVEEGAVLAAVLNVTVSVGACAGAAAGGLALGSLL